MSFSEDLYIYDLGETDFTHNGFPIVDFWEEPEINRQINGRYALTGLYMKEGQLSELIVKDAVIRAQVPDRTWQLFRIATIKDDGEYIQFTARFKGLDVNRNFIDNMIAKNQTVTSIMRMIGESLEFNQNYQFLSNMGSQHQFTIKQNHPIDAIIGSNSGNQNLISVVGGELDMYGNTFYLKEQLGNDNGFRIDFGINLESIVEIISEEEPPNTLYLIGATPEGDYDEEREPITLKYLEAPGMVITDENRVIATYTNENCKTVADLKEWADTELFGRQKVHMQKSAHEISLVDLANTLEYKDYLAYVELQLGDVIHGTLQRSRKNVTERVIEYTWYPRLKEYKKLGTGSSVDYYTEKAESKINTLLKKIDHNTDFLKESIINATQLITGNDKGHIMFWPKNRPRELRIMDTDDANTAKYVWRFNLAGLGHSSNGVDGPFPLAITQDGKIVADYILAGVLRAIDIIGVNIYGSMISGAEIIGSVLKSVGPYGNQVVIDGGGYAFEDTQTEQVIAKLHNNGATLTLERIRNNSGFNDLLSFSDNVALLMHQKLFEINAPITRMQKLEAQSAVIDGRLDVDSIYIKGVQLIPGQGGGGTPSGTSYEPINISSNIKNNANIVAWLEKYTKQYGIHDYIGLAYALIMVENASTDGTDDIMQSSESAGYPGPGYLTGEASVNQGCKHLANVLNASFAKNVDVWGAMQSYNFGSAYVNWLSARGGINTTDLAVVYSRDVVAPSLGNTTGETYTYINPVSVADGRTWLYRNGGNFHYAAMIRQYVRVVEVTWRAPIDNPITITSEFGWRDSPINPGTQELHNGIDLVGGTGATTNIYASGPGTVVFAGWENSYGNYVIIQHANGLFTGYAHNSSLAVSNGEVVSQGQKIANMGNTGDSRGAHTHFQFFRNGPWPSSSSDFINPREYINF